LDFRSAMKRVLWDWTRIVENREACLNGKHCPEVETGGFGTGFGTPVDIGVANAPGVSTLLVREDHVHNHPAGLGANLHHNQVHGAADHINVERWVWIPYALAQQGTVNLNNRWRMGHTDDAQVNYVDMYPWKVPSDFVAVTEARVILMPTANGQTYSQIYVGAASIDEVSTDNVPAYAQDPAIVAWQISQTRDFVADFVAAGLVIGDYVGIRWTRDATNVLDTVNAAVRVLGTIIKYTAEQ